MWMKRGTSAPPAALTLFFLGPRGALHHVGRGHRMEPLEGHAPAGPLADDPDQMDQRVASLHRGLEALRAQHVAGDALDSFEPLEVGLGAGPHDAANGEAVGLERVDHGLAHEAGAAGDEDPLHGWPECRRGRGVCQVIMEPWRGTRWP